MTHQSPNTPQAPTESSTADMQMVLRFLKISSSNHLDGKALEDRLLTSIAIALHRNSVVN